MKLLAKFGLLAAALFSSMLPQSQALQLRSITQSRVPQLATTFRCQATRLRAYGAGEFQTIAPGAFADVPTTVAVGELTTPEVTGYFGLLFTIIGTLIFLSVRDLTRSNEYKTKRTAFIESIEGEIAELNSQGDKAALEIAAELDEKLGKLRAEVKNEEKDRLESRWLGAGRFFMPLEFQEAPKEADSRITAAEYSDKPLQDVEELIGNRFERRQQKKRRKRKSAKSA